MDYHSMLAVALAEARLGLKEGGIPIGAAIFNQTGKLVGAGHNRRVQQGDPSVHGETDAFRNAGRQKSYRKLIMVITLAPCWYCSGLVRQFGFGTVVVGESCNFQGALNGSARLAYESLISTLRSAPHCWANISAEIPRCGTKTSEKSDG